MYEHTSVCFRPKNQITETYLCFVLFIVKNGIKIFRGFPPRPIHRGHLTQNIRTHKLLLSLRLTTGPPKPTQKGHLLVLFPLTLLTKGRPSPYQAIAVILAIDVAIIVADDGSAETTSQRTHTCILLVLLSLTTDPSMPPHPEYPHRICCCFSCHSCY